MNLKLLSEIEESRKFWRGTIFRFYFDEKRYFYDYLLTELPWEDFMILVNVTNQDSKKGAVYGGAVSINKACGEIVVTKKELQHTLGLELENWYLIEEDYCTKPEDTEM